MVTEHSRVAYSEAFEFGGVGRAFEPVEDVAQLYWLSYETQGPQCLQQPYRVPSQYHRELQVITIIT